MKKKYLFSLIASFISASVVFAGAPLTNYSTIPPVISTAAAPVWYNLMSCNYADVVRNNRFLHYDGTNLKTDGYDLGINDDIQHDKYLWRLEQGTTGAGYVILINKLTGKKIYADASIASDGVIDIGDTGIEWKMATAISTGAAGALTSQYCFNFEGSGLRYLNAGDGINKAWSMLVFNGAGSPAKSSGWFFYPVTTNKTVTFAQPDNGTITVTATNGTTTPTTLTTGNSVLIGTVATVSLTAANGYQVSTLTVNGADVTAQITNGTYLFPVNADATIAATFATSTTTAISTVKNSNALYISGNTLNIDGRLNNSTVTIYDICGKEALTSTEATINTSSLKKGIYVVKYSTSEGIKTAKITK